MSKKQARYDVLIVPNNPNQRFAPGLGGSLVRYLAARRIAIPTEEAVAETWAEVYCEPGASAHEPFVRGAYASDVPIYHEACVRFGSKRAELEGYPVAPYFYVEFRGCIFKEPLGQFRKQFVDLMQVRPKVLVRPHEALPPHAEVSEEEQPIERKKVWEREGNVGKAGTGVEEW